MTTESAVSRPCCSQAHPARRHFVEYFHHHTEIQFAVRATRAPMRPSIAWPGFPSRRQLGRGRSVPGSPGPGTLAAGVAVGIAMASVAFSALRQSGLIGPVRFEP